MTRHGLTVGTVPDRLPLAATGTIDSWAMRVLVAARSEVALQHGSGA